MDWWNRRLDKDMTFFFFEGNIPMQGLVSLLSFGSSRRMCAFRRKGLSGRWMGPSTGPLCLSGHPRVIWMERVGLLTTNFLKMFTSVALPALKVSVPQHFHFWIESNRLDIRFKFVSRYEERVSLFKDRIIRTLSPQYTI